MKSHRIKWLDFAKGFTMLFVILAHWGSYFVDKTDGLFRNLLIILSYTSFTFVMPLFFAISGYLYKKTSSIHDYFLLIYKKSISLLIPYVLFSAFFSIHGFKYNQIHNPLDILLGYKYGNGFYLWFLIVLFFIFIIVGILDLCKINLYIQFLIFVILTILHPYFWLTYNNTKTFSIYYSIISFIIFFYLGIFIRKIISNGAIIKFLYKHIFIKCCIFFVIWMIILLIQSKFTCLGYQTDFLSLSDFITKISSIILFFMCFIGLKHNILFRYFDHYGKLTLIIYLMHMIIITLLEYLSHLNIIYYRLPIFIIISIPIIWMFCICFCYLSNRSKFINFVFYPRKYINIFIKDTCLGKYLFNK